MSANPPRPLAASALILLLCAPGAYAQARIDSVEGKVEVAPGGIKLWIAVSAPPYTLKNGDGVRTAAKAKARISFPDESRVELGGESKFAVEKIAKGEASLKLDEGVLDAWVAKGLSKHFRVTTPSAVATARGTEFHVEVSPTKDTQVEVNDGVVGVKIKSGEETELGADKPFRSLLIISGRPMAMLPHPNEDAGGRKSDPGAVDCLHAANGALRKSVEALEACQDQAHRKRAKSGPLSGADEAAVREHNRQEIARFLNTTGIMDAPASAVADADDGGNDGSDGSDAAPAPKGGRDAPAEHAQLMKELGLEETTASGTAALTPEKIKILQGALARQGGSPVLQAALQKVANGKSKMTDAEAQALMKSLKLDEVGPSRLPQIGAPADTSVAP